MKEKNITYVHDFCFYKTNCYNRNIYTAVGLPEGYFNRFFESGFSKVKIISRNKIRDEQEISDSGFSIIINKNIIMPVLIPGYFSLLKLKTLIGICKVVLQSDLLVINFPSIIGVYVWLLNLFIRKPYTLEVAADSDQFDKKRFGFLVTLFISYIFPKVVNGSEGGIYVSKYLLKKYPHPNGIVASNVVIHTVADTKDIKTLNDLGGYILFVGGVNKRKGIKTLIDAIKNIVERGNTDVCLHIVGGHHDEDYLSLVESYDLKEHVKFLGILKPCDVELQMRHAKLYVQPSFSEGIPRATLEAMSFNLPVIATNLPGFAEILDKRCLFSPGDHIALSNLIERFLKADLSLMETLALNNITVRGFLYSHLQKARVDFYKNIKRSS